MQSAAHQFLTKEGLATRLGVSASTIDRWRRDGRIKAPVKIGGRRGKCLFPISVIDHIVAQGGEGQGAPNGAIASDAA